MRAEIRHGDCRDVLAVAKRAGELYHAVVTDPPYHLLSITKRFSKSGGADRTLHTKHHQYHRLSKGFMGKSWDGGDVAFRPETWRAVWDVLHPGAHMVVFGGTRTYHRLVCAVEDAGFEVRDCFQWLFGTGFPKSLNVSRAIDFTLDKPGAVRPTGNPVARMIPGADQAKDGWAKTNGREYQPGDYVPATPEGEAWTGWGTALKPAHELILLARKPLIGTVAQNVLATGCGGLNIDGCRVESDRPPVPWSTPRGGIWATDPDAKGSLVVTGAGRWPPNVLHDGSPEVLEAFGRFGEKTSGKAVAGGHRRKTGTGNRVALDDTLSAREDAGTLYGDSGTAARFFPAFPCSDDDLRFRYSSKANKAERIGSQHPTVKPIGLLQWLVRLVTPPGGRILDPFAGTATTGAAARAEGFDFTGIEMTDEYVEDCLRRLPEAAVDRGPWGLDLRDTLARNRAAHDKLTEALRRTSVRNPGEAA